MKEVEMFAQVLLGCRRLCEGVERSVTLVNKEGCLTAFISKNDAQITQGILLETGMVAVSLKNRGFFVVHRGMCIEELKMVVCTYAGLHGVYPRAHTFIIRDADRNVELFRMSADSYKMTCDSSQFDSVAKKIQEDTRKIVGALGEVEEKLKKRRVEGIWKAVRESDEEAMTAREKIKDWREGIKKYPPLTGIPCIDYNLIRKAEIEADRKRLFEQVDDLKCRLKEAKTDIEALRDLNRRKVKQIDELTKQLESETERADYLLDVRHKLEAELKQKDAKIVKLQGSAKRKQALIDEQREVINEQKKSLDELKEVIDGDDGWDSKAEKAWAMKEIKKLRKQIDKLSTELKAPDQTVLDEFSETIADRLCPKGGVKYCLIVRDNYETVRAFLTDTKVLTQGTQALVLEGNILVGIKEGFRYVVIAGGLHDSIKTQVKAFGEKANRFLIEIPKTEQTIFEKTANPSEK